MPICEVCLKKVKVTKRFTLPGFVYNNVYDEEYGDTERFDYYYFAKRTYMCESCAKTIEEYISKARSVIRNKTQKENLGFDTCPFELIDKAEK